MLPGQGGFPITIMPAGGAGLPNFWEEFWTQAPDGEESARCGQELPLGGSPLRAWWLRRRRATVRFPDMSWLGPLPEGRSRLPTQGGALLRGTALALLVIALAG
jgi:hypothetical protein